MVIKKRNGRTVKFNPNNIQKRIRIASEGLKVDPDIVFKQCIISIHDGDSTKDIDETIARSCHSMITSHPDYGQLGARILLSRLYKELDQGYLTRVSDKLDKITINNINSWGINYKKYREKDINDRDYLSARAFVDEYCLEKETPLELYSRVCSFIYNTKEGYERGIERLMNKKMSLASPQLLNAGTLNSNMISCTSLSLTDDSTEGILKLVSSATHHSRGSAGLGIYIGDLRSRYSEFGKGKGKASGIVKLCRVLEPFSTFFRQHEKRRGAFVVTNNIWHMEIEDFINMKDPSRQDNMSAKDLFYSVAMPNEFYKRVMKEDDWSLFCPKDEVNYYGKYLSDFTGEEWVEKYEELEKSNVKRKTIKAKQLMVQIAQAMVSSGVPYVYNRDNGNKNHNHRHLGIMKSQQLCNEFLAYHEEGEEAQCDLGSVVVCNHVKNGKVNWQDLRMTIKELVYVLNSVIDKNHWNTLEAKNTGNKQRAIGIGIAGLADLAMELDLPFDSPEFLEIQRSIQEFIYYYSIYYSSEFKETGIFKTTETINNSPLVKKGIFRFGKVQPEDSKLNWKGLKEKVQLNGVCNSLFVCNMPTSGTSKLLDCIESFEAMQAPIIKRKIVSGEYIVPNKYVYKALEENGLLNDETVQDIIQKESVQHLDLPNKEVFKTVWELGSKNTIDMAKKRKDFVDMGESMNLYYEDPTATEIAKNLIVGAKGGLTSGVYYTKPKKKTKVNKDLGKIVKEKPNNSPFECFGCST